VAMVSPGPDDVVHPGDVLALLGSNEKLGRIEEMLKPSKS
jgi:K+/H+ antiporter YhaU regulatory subunit KhtT